MSHAQRDLADLLQGHIDKMRVPPNFKLKVWTSYVDHSFVQVNVLTAWPDKDHPVKLDINPMSMNYDCQISQATGTKMFTVDALPMYREHPAMVIESIYDLLRMLWMHELHEWFTVDGVPHIEPHPQGRGSLA